MSYLLGVNELLLLFGGTLLYFALRHLPQLSPLLFRTKINSAWLVLAGGLFGLFLTFFMPKTGISG